MRYWIVSWDNLGVDFFEEITEHHPDNWARTHLFDTIKQSKIVEKNFSFNLNHLKMRAQMNAHRHYEIYVFTSDDDTGSVEIKDWFTTDPQKFADWVRNNHSYKVYDNRRTHKEVIV
jgi:hypothetical protein